MAPKCPLGPSTVPAVLPPVGPPWHLASNTLHRHTAAAFQSAGTDVEGEIITKKEI